MHAQTPRQKRKQWGKDRTEFATKWFHGDEDAAQSFLDSLPYSEIPGWYSANEVMNELAKLGALAPNPKENNA